MLDPKLKGKVKKKKIKPPLESAVKKTFTDRLKSMVKKHLPGVRLIIDVPGASEYGVAGRPDIYIYLGGLFVMVEVKRDLNTGLRVVQHDWHRAYNDNHADILAPPVLLLKGKGRIEPIVTVIIALYKRREIMLRTIDDNKCVNVKLRNKGWCI